MSPTGSWCPIVAAALAAQVAASIRDRLAGHAGRRRAPDDPVPQPDRVQRRRRPSCAAGSTAIGGCRLVSRSTPTPAGGSAYRLAVLGELERGRQIERACGRIRARRASSSRPSAVRPDPIRTPSRRLAGDHRADPTLSSYAALGAGRRLLAAGTARADRAVRAAVLRRRCRRPPRLRGDLVARRATALPLPAATRPMPARWNWPRNWSTADTSSLPLRSPGRRLHRRPAAASCRPGRSSGPEPVPCAVLHQLDQ